MRRSVASFLIALASTSCRNREDGQVWQGAHEYEVRVSSVQGPIPLGVLVYKADILKLEGTCAQFYRSVGLRGFDLIGTVCSPNLQVRQTR